MLSSKEIFVIAIICSISSGFSSSDPSSSKGTKFMVGLYYKSSNSLFVLTDETGMVEFEIKTKFDGIENTTLYNVNSTNPTQVDFNEEAVMTSSDQRDKAILVQSRSGKKISVYVGPNSDGYFALPCDSMTSKSGINNFKYITNGYTVIMTCEAETTVTVTPVRRYRVPSGIFEHTEFGPSFHPSSSSLVMEESTIISAQVSFFITSSPFETIVNSNKPIAVVVIPRFTDLGNQIPSHTTWGSTFLLNSFIRHDHGYVHYNFISLYNNTKVSMACVKKGKLTPTKVFNKYLKAQRNVVWKLQVNLRFPTRYCYVESSKPITVTELNYDNEYSFSSSAVVTVPPISQYLKQHTLVPLPYDAVTQRYVSVLVRADFFQPNNILLNDNPLEQNATLWQQIYNRDGNITGYVITIPLNNSLYTVSHSEGILVYSRYVDNDSIIYGHVNGIGLKQNINDVLVSLTSSTPTPSLQDDSSVRVKEGTSESSALCAHVTTTSGSSTCPVLFEFSVYLSLRSLTNVSADRDVSNTSLTLMFAPCEPMACTTPNIISDSIAEKRNELEVSLNSNQDLPDYITISNATGILIIEDDDDMIVGFTSTSYTGTETDGYATVCIAVLNSFQGALIPFNITALPKQGEVSSGQYALECNRDVAFAQGQSSVCLNYTLFNDDMCEVEENTTHFDLRLSLTRTIENLLISSSMAHAEVVINDAIEPECYVMVEFERESYTLSEEEDTVEVCIISTSRGIKESFSLIVVTPNNNFPDSPLQTMSILNFSVDNNQRVDKKCSNYSVDYITENVTCDFFDCNSVTSGIEAVLFNDSVPDRVKFIKPNSTITVVIPEYCLESCADSSVTLITTTILLTLCAIVVIVLFVMIGVVFCYRRKRRCVKLSGELNSHNSVSLHETNRSIISNQLRKQLIDKGMLISNHELELSKTIGQGESGLVYKGYLNTAVGKEVVAVKTVKALFSNSNIKSLANEVSTMLLLEHPNVMSLLGVCLEREVPLLIMPFMSNGCVLDYLKSNREELLCISSSKTMMVVSAKKSLLSICYQILKGMVYLAKEKFVHRDLAARNCMIDGEGIIKVADFGLTEEMYCSNYIHQDEGMAREEKVPIRWMAPESIESDIYTEATDVWSFGVTVWEVFTCGKVPYSGIPAMAILRQLQSGERLDQPNNVACQTEVYELMKECWSADPTSRPKFQVLVIRFNDLLEKEAGYLELCTLPTNDDTKEII